MKESEIKREGIRVIQKDRIEINRKRGRKRLKEKE